MQPWDMPRGLLPACLPLGPCAQAHCPAAWEGRTPKGTPLGAAQPPGRIPGFIFPLSMGSSEFGTREMGAHVSRVSLVFEGKLLSGKYI